MRMAQSPPRIGTSFKHSTVCATTTTRGSNGQMDYGLCSSSTDGVENIVTGVPGAWYKVKGDGQILTASTCSDYTTFDTQISVFRQEEEDDNDVEEEEPGGGGGGNCDNISCVSANNNFCGAQSSVAWKSDIGRMYYIFVHGVRGAQGTFELRVFSSGIDNKENDYCESAIQPQLEQ